MRSKQAISEMNESRDRALGASTAIIQMQNVGDSFYCFACQHGPFKNHYTLSTGKIICSSCCLERPTTKQCDYPEYDNHPAIMIEHFNRICVCIGIDLASPHERHTRLYTARCVCCRTIKHGLGALIFNKSILFQQVVLVCEECEMNAKHIHDIISKIHLTGEIIHNRDVAVYLRGVIAAICWTLASTRKQTAKNKVLDAISV